MFKRDHFKFLRLSLRRHKRTIKRRRNKKYYTAGIVINKISEFQRNHDLRIILNSKNQLYTFLNKVSFCTNTSSPFNLLVPKVFCFHSNYKESIEFLKIAVSLFDFKYSRDVTIDFTECESIDYSALFPLKVILMDFLEFTQRIQKRITKYDITPRYKFIKSKCEKVNHYLFLLSFINEMERPTQSGLLPFSDLGVFKGEKNQKHYNENKKSIAATRVVDYINDCLKNHHYHLNPVGQNSLEGILSEVLNNCEDHSPLSTWYVSANYFKEEEEFKKGEEESNDKIVSELNLCFLNFGYSIYDGFKNNKIENQQTYNVMKEKSDYILNNFNCPWLTEENLFTLYALQDNISRLKFENESRGTGTMKFINSFLLIGDYEDKAKGYIPKLSIISGNTYLTCDRQFRPFMDKKEARISLNAQNSLNYPPEDSHLKNLPLSFPGTLITVKVYLNRSHIRAKREENGN